MCLGASAAQWQRWHLTTAQEAGTVSWFRMEVGVLLHFNDAADDLRFAPHVDNAGLLLGTFFPGSNLRNPNKPLDPKHRRANETKYEAICAAPCGQQTAPGKRTGLGQLGLYLGEAQLIAKGQRVLRAARR